MRLVLLLTLCGFTLLTNGQSGRGGGRRRGRRSVPNIQGAATCDNQMTFFADGVELAAHNDWSVASPISLPANTQVIGIYCLDAGGVAGTLASFDNGVVTDSSWRCVNAAQEPQGWNEAGFDDSQWDQAYEISNNGQDTYRHIIDGISTSAKWIWTSQWHAQDLNVYCRKELVPTIQGAATCDNQMMFFADGVELAAHNDWSVASPISLPANTQVIGIYCLDAGVVAGTLASFDNGVVTDSSWRCVNAAQEPQGWNEAGFDDSQWGQAYEISDNGQDTYRHIIDGISTSAKWIWTSQWHAQDLNVYCRKELVPTIQGAATCDNQMTFFADGVELAAHNDWSVASPISLPANTQVIGIYCLDAGGVGGTLASFDNGVVTDSSWRCVNAAQEPQGWNEAGFDDSQWGQAYEISNNGQDTYRHIIDGISTSAKWIWTSQWHAQDLNVYCRKELVGGGGGKLFQNTDPDW